MQPVRLCITDVMPLCNVAVELENQRTGDNKATDGVLIDKPMIINFSEGCTVEIVLNVRMTHESECNSVNNDFNGYK